MITPAERIEMEWVRQAVALGFYQDRRQLLAAADDLVRRAEALANHAEPTGRPRQVAATAASEVRRLRQAMADPAAALPRMRALWIEMRRRLRPAVFTQLPADCSRLVFCTVYAAHTVPNVVGTHVSWTHKPGGDLCLLSGLGSDKVEVRRILAGRLGPGHVHGLDLWFDADRLVFAWRGKRAGRGRRAARSIPVAIPFTPPRAITSTSCGAAHEPAHLYEVKLDGSGLRQLTSEPYWTDVEPTWLPDGGVAFASDRCATARCATCSSTIWPTSISTPATRPASSAA